MVASSASRSKQHGSSAVSALWKRPNEDDGSDETTSSDEEEDLLSTDSESEESPHHAKPCICDLDGLLTVTAHLGPADFSTQDLTQLASEARGSPSACPCPLTLFKAHALLDELLDRPATRVKKKAKATPPPPPRPLAPTRTWDQLDGLLQVLTTRGRLHDHSTSAYDSCMASLRGRLRGLLNHPLVTSRSFRRVLYAEEAKALSKILQRARALPEDAHTANREPDEAQDGFIVSLQRNYLRQAAYLLHWVRPEDPGSVDPDVVRNRMRYRLPNYDRDPALANSDPAHRTIFHNKYSTFLRSGRKSRSYAEVRALVQEYVLPILGTFDHFAIDTPDQLLARPVLVWIDEATGDDEGVRLSQLLPDLGASFTRIFLIRRPDSLQTRTLPISLSALPEASFPKLFLNRQPNSLQNPALSTTLTTLSERVVVWEAACCTRLMKRLYPSKTPNASSDHDLLSAQQSVLSNTVQILDLVRAICQERSEARRGSSFTSCPNMPPSLGILCALVLRHSSPDSPSHAHNQPRSHQLGPAGGPKELPIQVRSLVEDVYRCVSCGIPVGGTPITSLDNWHRHPDRSRTALNSVALPSLREQRWLPNMGSSPPKRKGGDISDEDRVILGGRGPWLLHRAFGQSLPRWARPDEALLVHDEETPSASERAGDSTGKLIEDLDWRFCATCALAHLDAEQAERSGLSACQCLLCAGASQDAPNDHS